MDFLTDAGTGMSGVYRLETQVLPGKVNLNAPGLALIEMQKKILKVEELANILHICLDSGAKKVLLVI